jgi:hypothetical protein
MLNRIGKPNSYLEQKTETIHKKTLCLCDFVANFRLLHCVRNDREQITDNR